LASRAARGAAVLALVIAALMSFVWWWILRSVPPLDGEVVLRGLRAAVDVRFDSFAVPHVLAGSDEDAWRSVGFLQGRDRLWQMELYRRAASGRLSELLGEATVPIDQRFLALGLRRAAEGEWERLPQPVRQSLEGYAAGVNSAMQVPRMRWPLEHQLLGLTPEPWTPIDSLAIAKLFAWRLGENHSAELLRYAMVEELGPRALELFPEAPDWAPAILGRRAEGTGRRAPTSDRPVTTDQRPATSDQRPATSDHRPSTIAYPPGLEWLSPDAKAMSNSWVVHGSRTATGRPLLANDPHLALEMPAVWWEVHLVSNGFNVAGVTIPGIPFVVIGHNSRIGWGLTNTGADVQDFFVEQLDESRTKYRDGDRWVPLQVRHHEIRVSGRRDPVPFDVRSTRHGPVLNAQSWRDAQPGDSPLASPLAERVLALRWDAVELEGAAAAFHALARAGNWDEFVAAVRRFSAPSQNFVYADVDGNIGYAMSGVLPVRAGADGSLPVEGSMAASDWQGAVDPQSLPAVLNPPSGQFVTANNEVDPSLPYLVTRDWVAPFRARRITDLLESLSAIESASMQEIQTDITSLSADWILKHIEIPGEVGELSAWNRRIDERPVAALYEAFERALWQRTFADEMTPPLYDQFYRYAGNQRFAGLHAIITDAHASWFDDRATPGVVESRADIARVAAADALAALRAQSGSPGGARWDRIHAAKFSHVLSGGGRLLDWFFSRGPVPVPGDTTTVNKTTIDLRRPYQTSEAASYRQILDVGAWDSSLGVITTGQSGHPHSPHYFDQNSLWRTGRYRPLPFTRAAVDAATIARLKLTP
jgi:penicillin amidase